ncbi:MAG: hypothetical protein KJZ69_06435 [Phycisphaerales bacterium]|nr:hypothetical protein [Phycisphaerales bacterium]
MLKAIVGVIVGYVAMVVVVMVCFTGAWFILGEEGSFKPGSWDASITWLLMSFAVGLVAAILGGLVCSTIASRGSQAPRVLAGLVLVLGIVMSVPAMMKEPDASPRPSEMTMQDAASKARQPMFSYILNPIIGAVGVLAGAAMRRR